MATRTGSQPTAGSTPITVEHSGIGDSAHEAVGSVIDTFGTVVSASHRIGSDLVDSATAAFREGLELSGKISHAVVESARDTVGFGSLPAQPMEGWSRLLDTSARAYTDYATRIAGLADDAATKVRDAVSTVSSEVGSKVGSLGR